MGEMEEWEECDGKLVRGVGEGKGGEVWVKMGKVVFVKGGEGVRGRGKKMGEIRMRGREGEGDDFGIGEGGG